MLCFTPPLQLDTLLILNLLKTQPVADLTGAIGACPLRLHLSACPLRLGLSNSPVFIRPPSRGLGTSCFTLSSAASVPFTIDLNANVITPSRPMLYRSLTMVLADRQCWGTRV